MSDFMRGFNQAFSTFCPASACVAFMCSVSGVYLWAAINGVMAVYGWLCFMLAISDSERATHD